MNQELTHRAWGPRSGLAAKKRLDSIGISGGALEAVDDSELGRGAFSTTIHGVDQGRSLSLCGRRCGVAAKKIVEWVVIYEDR